MLDYCTWIQIFINRKSAAARPYGKRKHRKHSVDCKFTLRCRWNKDVSCSELRRGRFTGGLTQRFDKLHGLKILLWLREQLVINHFNFILTFIPCIFSYIYVKSQQMHCSDSLSYSFYMFWHVLLHVLTCM
jgi:hypothetical protein